nr:H512 [uncultured bacterium]
MTSNQLALGIVALLLVGILIGWAAASWTIARGADVCIEHVSQASSKAAAVDGVEQATFTEDRERSCN